MSKLPLEGIRVIDHGVAYTGPGATSMLGDMGAEVIRVESIRRFPTMVRGMVARPVREGVEKYPGYADNDPGSRPWDRWWQHHALNRNKYGITLDLSRPKGVEIYKKLVKISDVVIENFSQGVMDKLGIGYAFHKGVKPDIIMISTSGLGDEGPYKGYSTFGSNIDSVTGMMSLRGYPGDDMMIRNPMPVWSDNVAAATAAFAAMVSIYYRNRTGKGQFVDLSQVESFLPHMGESIMEYTMNGRVPLPMGNRDSSMAPHGCYPCRGEDKWVVIAVSSDKEWQALCRAMGEPKWAKGKKFTTVSGRWHNQDELDGHISRWTKVRDNYEVMHLLQKEGVPAGVVTTPIELYEDFHLKERNFFVEATHREIGTCVYPGMFFKFSRTPARIRILPNLLGEHNDYVYGEILGMSREEIAQLEEEKLIGDAYLPEVP